MSSKCDMKGSLKHNNKAIRIIGFEYFRKPAKLGTLSQPLRPPFPPKLRVLILIEVTK